MTILPTQLAAGFYLEGLAVDQARQCIWYSDVVAGGIHGVDWDGTPGITLNPGRKWTGGIAINADGKVLSSGEHGILWNDPDSGQSGWLIRDLPGLAMGGINEMAPDGHGGLYFGTLDIAQIIAGQPTRGAAIFRLTADGELIGPLAEIGFANGMAHDVARQRFYVNDSFTCSWAFDVGEDGKLHNKTLLLDRADVDGMALDADGTVWITGFASNEITRISPDGARLEPILPPCGTITQVRFGGADMRDYVLTACTAEGGNALKEGRQITEPQSMLYRGRTDVAGMKIEPSRFTL